MRCARAKLPGMTPATIDPFIAGAGITTLEADADHAVVQQGAAEALDNHVGVRHASALFTAGHQASRELLAAVLGVRARLELLESDVHYVNVGFGLLTSTARPAGGAWPPLDGRVLELEVEVTTEDEHGKTVAKIVERWRATRG
jgi:Domain of unknown function (DUF4442)